MYKRAENMIPQLDSTFNVSDSSDTDSHDYLDLASSNIIQYRTRGQKQRHEENEMVYTYRCSAHIEYIKPNTKVKTQRQKVPDDEDIDMAKIVKDDAPRHDRQRTLETKRQLQEKEAKRLVLAKAKQLKIGKDKDAKRLQMEKAQIEALIEKHRPRTPKTPDEVNTMGTGKNANTKGQKGIEKEKPSHKKATRASQIKTSQNKGDKANKGKQDTLLGDPTVNTKVYTHGLLNLLDLEGVDEDRLRELQNAVQEQLYQRDEERERNITKRVQEFEKTFDFVNSHLLKGVATMAKLTKTDSRQPIGKIKPTDKMVMMPSLFDGTKPAMSKQHYERFNLYINFQTKSGHLMDPVREAIGLFKHT